MIYHVSFLMTDQCNSKCKYCYVNAQTGKPEKMLDIDQVKGFLKNFYDNKGRVVQFSGGEVLLYPGIEEVLEYAKGLGMNVTMFTNGLLLDTEKFARIKGFVDAFAVSLDGPEEVHDANRGVTGAYQKVIDVLKMFKENMLQYTVQMTIGKSNLQHIEHVARIANEYHAEGFKLANIMRVGRGAECPEEILSEEELLALKRKSIELSEALNYRPIFQTNLYTKEEIELYFMTGTLLAPIYWIDSTGDICMYTTSNKSFFKVGHITAEPFANAEEIMEKRNRLNKVLFEQVKGKKIVDLFEEIEKIAGQF